MPTAPTVLIVDDMADTRNLLRILLSRKSGYNVLEAACGEEAMQQARAHKPDLILLDYMMPDMNGVEVCRGLRSDPATAHIPVVILTARSDSKTRDECLAAGASDFMTKPIMPAEFLESIAGFVNQTVRT